jgi:ABC-type multidrug transport system fused ATPase/permease subunit
MLQLLYRLWQHIGPHRRGQLILLLFLIIIASLAEIISIGAVLPFLAALAAPERILDRPEIQSILQMLEITERTHLLFPLTMVFGIAALVAGVMRLLLLWANTRLSYAIGADLSNSIYRRTLYQPYAVHCSRNSSEIINGISNKTSGTINVIIMLLTLASSAVMLVAILVALMNVDLVITLGVFGGFGFIYGTIIYLTRRTLSINSERIARESTNVIKSLQEGLGGIRDVLIDGSQAAYCQIYRNADLTLRYAQGSNLFISNSPRYAMEALGMVLISILAYLLAQQPDGVTNAIPILGAFALGAQRLLPVLQQSYAAWSGIRGGQDSLKDTLELLDQPLPKYADQPAPEKLDFNYGIYLKNIGFRYDPQAPYILKDVNYTINKGSRVGFIGATGSGKSTLLDIVMGLLHPEEGDLEIDGKKVTTANCRAWQKHIAHVPQSIYLADSTIEENIAFGIPNDKIDHKRVRDAARQAQISMTVESWPNQYQTIVGERGIRLSGGQRQRIGIARALYKQADVIIFDEATSALDSETEQTVMQAIENLSRELTLLIIAHRISTLKDCTEIIEIRSGRIRRRGNYHAIANQSKVE